METAKVVFTNVKIFREDKSLPLPKYAKHGDVGIDVYAAIDYILNPGEHKLIPSGIRIALPHGYEAQVRPRSGLAAKHCIGLVNSPGTIDAGFRGPIMINLINHGKKPYEVKKGDRIAQMVFKKVEYAELEEVNADKFDISTERGEGGWGSTGK